MKNKQDSSHRPEKKAHVSTRSGEQKSNVEQKKSNNSQQKTNTSDMQSGFTEPRNQRGNGMDFSETTVGVP